MMQAIAKGSPKVVNPLSFMAELDHTIWLGFSPLKADCLLLIYVQELAPQKNNMISWDACHCCIGLLRLCMLDR